MVAFLAHLAWNSQRLKMIDRPRFTVCIRTENQNQVGICPFALREVSVLAEPTLGHLRYRLTDVPPQSNSPPDKVFRAGHAPRKGGALSTRTWALSRRSPPHWISKETIQVVVFHCRRAIFNSLQNFLGALTFSQFGSSSTTFFGTENFGSWKLNIWKLLVFLLWWHSLSLHNTFVIIIKLTCWEVCYGSQISL